MKKHKKILEKLELEKRLLIQFCNMNDDHNKFSDAKLSVYNQMIKFIRNL